jgi:hypothetical protein
MSRSVLARCSATLPVLNVICGRVSMLALVAVRAIHGAKCVAASELLQSMYTDGSLRQKKIVLKILQARRRRVSCAAGLLGGEKVMV